MTDEEMLGKFESPQATKPIPLLLEAMALATWLIALGFVVLALC